jgi:sugar phosphate isomerase/epimerase
MELAPAIGTTFDYSIPLDIMLGLVHEAGFDYISLGMNLEHSNYHTPDGRKNIKSLLSRYDLKLDSIHANYIHEDADIASQDEDIRKRGVGDFIEVLRASHDLDCGIVIFHAHRGYDPFDNISCICDSVLHSVDTLVAESQKLGIKLAVENLYNLGSNRILEALFERFSPDSLGFCYDSSHDNISKETVFGDILRNYSRRLIATHFSDNHGSEDEHMIPFTADVDFEFICEYFPVDTYRGNLLLETETRNHPELDGFTQEFLRQSFDAGMNLRRDILADR